MVNDDDIESAWQSQSRSLKQVQVKGSGLEQQVLDILKWKSGRVSYDSILGYDLQVDNVYPTLEKPEIIASVTYTEPDTKGHSNENKLQLKVGELALLKYAYPDCKIILVIGGTKDSWLPYVLIAFEYFFDEVVFLWNHGSVKRLQNIAATPGLVTQKHKFFWNEVIIDWAKRELKAHDFIPPTGLLRYKIADKIKNQQPPVDHPELVNSRIAALCLNRSKSKGGREWDNFRARNWNSLEQSRSYFNPVEALIEISLTDAGLDFKGGIAHDIPVPSFLHELGMRNTLLSEDFILFSKKYKLPVYIQCKASGGGRLQHGKNIQNRAKEQVSRGILYRSTLVDGNISFGKKGYIWISVLDGNWGVTAKSPLKYIHMLQLAGYDYFMGSESLVDEELEPLAPNLSPLISILIKELDCIKSNEIPESLLFKTQI